MWLIVLEAVAALAVLVFLVWWTMFSGRRGGELPPELSHEPPPTGDSRPAPGAQQAELAQEEDAGGAAGERGGTKKLKG